MKLVNLSFNLVWIGLLCDIENNFYWIDGIVLEYINWGLGLLDNSFGNN